jgi:hypothetical protein
VRPAGHHSPALWGLLAGLAVFTGELVAVVGWNVYERRAEVRRWLRM